MFTINVLNFKNISRRMLRLSSKRLCLHWRLSSSVKITDEKGAEIVSNWPKVFGAGVHKTGKESGLPITEEKWNIGNYITKGSS